MAGTWTGGWVPGRGFLHACTHVPRNKETTLPELGIDPPNPPLCLQLTTRAPPHPFRCEAEGSPTRISYAEELVLPDFKMRCGALFTHWGGGGRGGRIFW